MKKITKKEMKAPLDIPPKMRARYKKNYLEITKRTGNLMLFAGDQRVEHLNYDFVGKGIAKDDADPEHLFRIADQANIGVFATQLGLIAKYGMDYKKVPYLIKLNSKTNLVKTKQKDPYSSLLNDVDDVLEFQKESKLKILGVGYTLYIGSEFEPQMMRTVSKIVEKAHDNGLIVVLWIYPRGKAVKDEKDPQIIAGATAVGSALGADFIKVNYPIKKGKKSAEIFKEAVISAGRSKVICAGGASKAPKQFFQELHDQIHISKAHGNATGRNIHQKPLDKAVKMSNAISAITLDGKTVKQALSIYNKI
ncbi:aldolase [Candidatus Falkowbacteria bacterium]|jgi:fructose-bisphosphate aldolase / 6-deoxy-5-ketofructose 1-phosphate synthase|nr:aldolase [Candidatus Falkowbacteria bacterium]MBT7007062.1 aldolase [Candidatus Falkowbacteria bacterium]